MRRFSEEVIAADGLVLAGRCYERESVPYKAFDSVIDALARHLRRLPGHEVAALLPRHPDLLVRMFPVLGGVTAMNAAPAARVTSGEPQEQRNQAFASLREVLHRLAQRQPLVITIDDWQWADADSVLLARDLVRHRDSPPMMLVLTRRPGDGPEAEARLEAVATQDMRHIHLESLVEAQAIQLVRSLQKSFAPSLELDRARLHRQLRDAREDPKVRGLVLLAEGVLEYWVCQLSRAEQTIRGAERIFREEAMNAMSELKSARMFLTFTLRHLGAWAQLRDPAEARRMVAEAKWMLPNRAFHTQHWYELEARAEIAMYDHTVERDLPELEALFDGLDRSVLLRVTTVRANSLWLRGRLALCQGDVKSAKRVVARMTKVDDMRARVYEAILEGSIAAHARDASAIAKLRRASELAERHELRLHAAAARFQLGKLVGGTEGVEHVQAATSLMVSETVARPERFADWLVPGLHT